VHKRVATGFRLCSIFAACIVPALVLGASIYNLPYVLTDEQGKSLQLNQFQGKPAFVTMEYATCQFICSISLTQLKRLQQLADIHQQQYEFIIIGLDPQHDTPAAWKNYREARNLHLLNWHYLSPLAKDLQSLAALIGIRYWYDNEILMHDFRVIRVDASGNVVGSITLNDPLEQSFK